VVQIEDITGLKIVAQALNTQATTLTQHIPPLLPIITRRISAVQRASIRRVAPLLDIRDHIFITNILRDTNSHKDPSQVFPLLVLLGGILGLLLKITMRVEIKSYLDQTDLTTTLHPSTQDSTIRPRRSSVTATNIAVALNILQGIIRTMSQPLHLSIIRIQDNTMTQLAAVSLLWPEVALIE
jgi:hypothetical protein